MNSTNKDVSSPSNLDSNFFLNKWDAAEFDELRLGVSTRYLDTDSNTNYEKPPIIVLRDTIDRIERDGKLQRADFRFIHTDIKISEIPKQWGFTPDPKIANLVITLNRLGLYTSAACEGHLEREEPYPQVSFWNEEFYNVIAHLRDWPEISNTEIKIRSTSTISEKVKGRMFDLLLAAGSLNNGQALSENLDKYLHNMAR